MSYVTHFRTELKIQVNAVESELDALAVRIARGEESSDTLIRMYLDHLSRHLTLKRQARTAAVSVLSQCVTSHDKAGTASASERSACVHVQDPDGWSVCARNRACAAMDLVSTAIDEAAYAALEAWLAEKAAARAKESQECMRP